MLIYNLEYSGTVLLNRPNCILEELCSTGRNGLEADEVDYAGWMQDSSGLRTVVVILFKYFHIISYYFHFSSKNSESNINNFQTTFLCVNN